MSGSVVVSMLLRPKCSESSHREALRAALDGVGLTERTEGAATLTVRMTPARFKQLFGTRPTPVPSRLRSRPPGPADDGAPAGYICEVEPTVPASLNEFVASVGIEPPLARF
jgi:hypothetical protein